MTRWMWLCLVLGACATPSEAPVMDARQLTISESALYPNQPDLPSGALARFGQVGWSVPGRILDVVTHPSSRWVIVCEDRGRIHLLEPESGRLRHTFQAPGCQELAISREGTLLISGGVKGVDVWSLEARAKLAHHAADRFVLDVNKDTLYLARQDKLWRVGLGPGDRAAPVWSTDTPCGTSLAISPDGSRVACVDASTAWVRELTSGVMLWSHRSSRGLLDLAFDAAGARVAVTTRSRHLEVWEIKTGRRTQAFAVNTMHGVLRRPVFLPQGPSAILHPQDAPPRIVSWEWEGDAPMTQAPGTLVRRVSGGQVWRATGARLTPPGRSGHGASVRWLDAPDTSEVWSSSGDGVIQRWTLDGRSSLVDWGQGHGLTVWATHPSKPWRAAWGLWPEGPGLKVWLGEARPRFFALGSQAAHIRWRPGARELMVVDTSGAVHVFDARRGRRARRSYGTPGRSVLVGADDALTTLIVRDGRWLRAWDVVEDRMRFSIVARASACDVRRDAARVVCVSGARVVVLNEVGAKVLEFTSLPDLSHVAYTPDESSLTLVGRAPRRRQGSVLQIVRLQDQRVTHRSPQLSVRVTALRAMRDGRRLLLGDELGFITLWDLRVLALPEPQDPRDVSDVPRRAR